jgi:hypothetical protein
VRLGRDLDLSLEEFAADPSRVAAVGELEQRFRRFRRHLQRVRI